jgi:hypothetical protein
MNIDLDETFIFEQDHRRDTTMRMFDLEANKEVGTLSIVWRPRFFGRWGRCTPRVVFTGNVEQSAKQLFRCVLGILEDEEDL